MNRYCLLVMAKAPLPGLAKTRLTPPATPHQAAAIASAALLDTLAVVSAIPQAVPVVAMAGDLSLVADAAELRNALAPLTVLPQRGDGLADRLANAHADAARRCGGLPVVQIGMDTPQVTAALLTAAADGLANHDAVLGPAEDGGWWLLGLRDHRFAEVLRDVPMSRSDTGDRTLAALADVGATTLLAPELSDVDTMADALAVAATVPSGWFAAAVAGLVAGAAR